MPFGLWFPARKAPCGGGAGGWADGGTDFARDLIERFLLAPGDDHLGAFADKDFGYGPADSAAAAGDQGDFVFEEHAESE